MIARTAWIGSCASLVLLLASMGRAQEEPVEKSSAFYTLRYHQGSEELATKALEVVDEAWLLVATAFGDAKAKPAKPLQVHLYQSVDDYLAADQKLTGGKFQRNLAMAHFDTRSAHVALQPACRAEVLRAKGLPSQTIALLAWEATHLARYELCSGFEHHPHWLADGLAALVSQQIYAKHFPGALETAPFWSMDLWDVQQLMKAKKLPPVASILADEIEDLELRPRYATRSLWFQFLNSDPQRQKLVKMLVAIRAMTGGSKIPSKIEALAKKTFASQEKAFHKFLSSSEPQWEELSRSLTTSGSEWVQIAFPATNAIAWNTQPIEGRGFRATGSLRILPGGRGQMNFLFARTDGGFYSIAFVADFGFTVFDYSEAGNEWIKVGDGSAPGLRVGVSSAVIIEVKGKSLTVQLDDLSWNIELPTALPPKMVWGLGAQAGPSESKSGSAGLWIDWKVEKL